MATQYHVDSGGSNTSPYDTWAKAATTFATADAVAVAGDLILVEYRHSETGLANVFNTAEQARINNPVTVASVDKDNSDALRAGAKLGNTGGNLAVGTGSDTGYVLHGVTLVAQGDLTFQQDSSFWSIDSTLNSNSTSSVSEWQIIQDTVKNFYNCETDSDTYGQVHLWAQTMTPETWIGGGIAAGSTAMDNFLEKADAASYRTEFNGLDLSNASTTLDYINGGPNIVQGPTFGLLSNSLVPSTFDFPGFTISEKGSRYEAYNVTSGTHTHGIQIEMWSGSIVDDTTEYLNASINSVPFSLNFTTRTGGTNYGAPLYAQLFEAELSANPTIKINFTSDTALNQSEAWLMIQYPDSTNPALGKVADTRDWGFMAGLTPGSLTTNSAAWQVGSTHDYEISYTVSGGGAGPHRVWFYLADDNAAIVDLWVDPEPEIS